MTNINNNNNLTYSIAYTEEVMQQKNKNFTEDLIVITDYTTGEKTQMNIIRNTKEWYEFKIIEVAQKVALSQKNNKKNKHFNITDLESYLVEEGFKILVKYDYNQHKYFEAYLRRCFAKKVFTFFTETEIEKHSDLFTTLINPVNNDEDEERNNVDVPVDIWNEVHEELEIDYLLERLDEDERYVAKRLLEGYNTNEISKELNTYYEKTRRTHNRVKEKLSEVRNRKRKTKTNPNQLQSTTSLKTVQRRNEYYQMRKVLDENNKDLHKTILEWTKERKGA